MNTIIINLNNGINDYKNKLLVFEKDPDEKKKTNKKRKDILYLLNNKGKTSKPTTMKNYNILYDDKNNIYY